jgi:hypothetical protein
MHSAESTAPDSPGVGRVLVVGGSCASGYGVQPERCYSAALARRYDVDRVEMIRLAIRMAQVRSMLSDVELRRSDVLILHSGLADCRPLMPRRWYRLVKATKRGRGRLEAHETDRRALSRLRRRFAREFEELLMNAAHVSGRLRVATLPTEFAANTADVEEALADFSGLLVCVVPERPALTFEPWPSDPEPYRGALTSLLVQARTERGLPVAQVDLAQILTEDDYLPDGIHPNALGHAKIAAVGHELVAAHVGPGSPAPIPPLR